MKMKPTQQQATRRQQQPISAAGSGSSRHGGAVIIMVISLMATLLVLGLFFFSWTQQELANASTFAGVDPIELDRDQIENFGLGQVLVGTRGQYRDSALFGNKWSILANTIGRIRPDLTPRDDVHPFNGTGIRLSSPTATTFELLIDPSGATMTTIDQDNFVLNFSYAASNGQDFFNIGGVGGIGETYDVLQPDAGYTYPDLNSLFLCMDYINDAGERVIIPSFFRPGYLKGTAGISTPPVAADQGRYASMATNFPRLSMRPHYSHVNAANNNYSRFISTEDFDQSGSLDMGEDRNNDGILDTGDIAAMSGDRNRILSQYPLTVDIDGDSNDTNRNGIIETSEGGGAMFGASEMGVWDGSGVYELDIDIDGDGIRDSIFLDLDHPVIDLPDGRQVVPVFAFKITDADALLNVNAHGNMALMRFLNQEYGPNASRARDAIYNLNFGANTGGSVLVGEQHRLWLSQSNMGMSRSEINPGYVLRTPLSNTSNPALARSQHEHYYNQTSFNSAQIANIELSWLLSGRPQFYSSTTPIGTNSFDIQGRYGEVAGIRGARTGGDPFPSAGTTWWDRSMPPNGNNDDDGDRNRNSGYTGRNQREARNAGTWYRDNLIGVDIPEVVHPLPLSGMGRWLENRGGSVGAIRKRNVIIGGNPATWPEYLATDLANVGQAGTSNVLWQEGNLLEGSSYQAGGFEFQVDEDDEMILSPNFSSPNDAPFPPAEIAALHLSDSDWQELGVDSRLRLLAPINFEHSRNAPDVRKNFTTDSRDRKEFGFSVSSLRTWESNEWRDNSNATFSDSNSLDFNRAFPPQFGDPGINPGVAVHGIQDPFRSALRRLLTVNFDSNGNIAADRIYPQHRLDINRLLVNFDAQGNPIYRQLMPHPLSFTTGTPNPGVLYSGSTVRPPSHNCSNFPVFDGTAANLIDAPVAAVGSFGSINLAAAQNNPYAQEVWARHDRQRMARDIFMILYTVGLPDDFNPTTGVAAFNGTGDTFPPAHWKIPDATAMAGNGVGDLVDKMAQFAVNLVDALDRDDVITQFEYDRNPGNGWNNNSSEMETVHGVEHQKLTFSEALWIHTAAEGQDLAVTAHDDDQENQFLHLELRNNWVNPVNFEEGKWRIRRVSGIGPVEERVLEFQDVNKTVAAGENFTIAMSSIGVTRPEFWIDTDASNGASGTVFDLQSPQNPLTTWDTSLPAPPMGEPFVDWEMAYSPAPSGWAVTGPGGVVGPEGTAFVGFDDPTEMETLVDMTLVLERRLNLDLGPTGDIPVDEEWVEVDRIQVRRALFNFPMSALPTPNQTQMGTALALVVSQERFESFQNFQENNPSGPPNSPNHTIQAIGETTKHDANDAWEGANSGERFKYWQAHFDRDFVSKYELMAIPLRSAENLISSEDIIDPSIPLPPNGTPAGWTRRLPFEVDDFAGSYFSDPTGRSTVEANRWYRFFEFVEVPSRANQVIHDGLGLVRTNPGVINLNTLRSEEVLAGIIDDDFQLSRSSANPTADRTSGAFTRNWWTELQVSRDGEETPGNPSTPNLPGTPVAKPFRPMSYTNPDSRVRSDAMLNSAVYGADSNPIQDTLLRFHSSTGGATTSLTGWQHTSIQRQQHIGLFDARALDDALDESADGNEVDMHTRHRLLGKIDNHTTVRSNVFLIWTAVRFHDAHQPVVGSPDIVQIGGVSEGLPVLRQFLVVDRTRLEEAWDPDSQTFDYQKLIIHRQQLPD